MKEVEIPEDGEKVKVQVLEVENAGPLQDVSREDSLREMGSDMIPKHDQSPSPSHLERCLCPIHYEDMRQKTAHNGWLYWRCPTTNCFVMTGVGEAKEYFYTVFHTLMDYYKKNWNKLLCFCREPLVLCKSGSKDNPGRIYFKCKVKGKKCKFFQWGDETITPQNRQWLEGQESFIP